MAEALTLSTTSHGTRSTFGFGAVIWTLGPLDRTNATKYYANIANTYNRLPTSFNKVNPDLTDYVVEKALDALFDQIAKEEANIRANPLARTTEILKKVFGTR